MAKEKIEFTLPADLQYSSLLRLIAEEIFIHIGFVQEWATRLKLVVDELFMNANRYGSASKGGTIFITFEFDKKEVIFMIEDEGKGKDKITAQQLRNVMLKNTDEMTDASKTSGRGLALISKLWTDDMQVKDGVHGGIAIIFAKKIMTTAPPAKPPIESAGKSEVATPVRPQGATEEVRVSGEIDAINLEDKIRPISEKVKVLPPGSTLVLDFQDLSYINSSFIGHMAAWINELKGKQSSLITKNVSKQVYEVLELVGLTKVIYVQNK